MYSGAGLRKAVTVLLVLRNATVVTMNAGRDVLQRADVVIENNRIVAVGPGAASSLTGVVQTLDCTGRVVVPG